MGRPLGSKNKNPYPVSSHRNSYWVLYVEEKLKKQLQAFKGMHNRVREGKSPSIEWERDLQGFKSFLKEIGEIPKDMIKPSVGRIDHKFGYQTGNIQWEEHSFNSIKRRGTRFENLTAKELK